MKVTKLLLLALCGMLCMGIFSCASSGGGASGGGSSGEVFIGNWEWVAGSDDGEGGDSIAEVIVAEEVIDGQSVTTYTFKGAVNSKAQWPWASLYVEPADDETLQKLQSATSVSFKISVEDKPSGLVYLQAPSPAVKDYGFHRRNFARDIQVGQVSEFDFQFRGFTQPGWAAMVRLNTSSLESLQFGVAGENEHEGVGSFNFKIWDFKLHM